MVTAFETCLSQSGGTTEKRSAEQKRDGERYPSGVYLSGHAWQDPHIHCRVAVGRRSFGNLDDITYLWKAA